MSPQQKESFNKELSRCGFEQDSPDIARWTHDSGYVAMGINESISVYIHPNRVRIENPEDVEKYFSVLKIIES